MEKLMKELNISQETRISFDVNIQENLIAHQQRYTLGSKRLRLSNGFDLFFVSLGLFQSSRKQNQSHFPYL